MNKKLSKNDHESDIELKKLEDELMAFSTVKLDFSTKKDMRRNLFERIEEGSIREVLPFGLSKLVNAIRGVAAEVETPPWAAVMMKERILDYAESKSATASFGLEGIFGVTFRKLGAAFVLVAFAFTAVFVFPFKVPVIHAKATFLSDFSGEVYIKRRVELIEATSDMVLEEGDTVLTKGDSSATIQFFDNSLSRLSENTSVQVSRLYQEPINPVITEIELFLEEGRLWAKVIRLIDDSSFVINTEDIRADVENKAAFDIYVQEDSTEVAVFENVVNLVPVNDSLEPAKIVVAGFKVELNGDDLENITVEKLPKSEMLRRKSVWVAANLTSDEQHDEMLIEDTEDEIEAEDGNILINGDVLSDPEAEEERQKFLEAYKILVNAEAQLVRGAKQEGIDGLHTFKWRTGEVIAYLSELEARDAFAAESLRTVIKDKVAVQLKDFAAFKPGDSLYRAKETLQEVELELAENDVMRIEIQLAQAGDLLMEIEQLVADNEPLLAMALLKRYQNRTNGISVDLTEENIEDVQDRFDLILADQAEHISMLTAIENTIVYLDHEDLKDKVKDVREDTLKKFVVALDKMPESVPEDVLYNVNDLYATYVDEHSDETDIIEPAIDNLTDEQQEGVQFISPDEEGLGDLGIFVMVPLEGTGDVKSEIEEEHIAKWSGENEEKDDGDYDEEPGDEDEREED